jgi:glycosyltransferase involved in cell wall biosynthesis
MVRELCLDGVVRFLGYVPHEELLRRYRLRGIDFVVLPSVTLGKNQHEGIPVCLMEAMACGIPVVSTSTGGIAELLRDGAGVMVPPADPQALADAIERLVLDPDLRRKLAQAGRRRVEEEFAVEATAGKLMAYIQAGPPDG